MDEHDLRAHRSRGEQVRERPGGVRGTAPALGWRQPPQAQAVNHSRATISRPAPRSCPGGEPEPSAVLARFTPVRGSTSTARLGQERHLPLTATREPAVTRLPGQDPVHARDARRRARVLLAAWGLGEHASLGELVVSELVSNAVCHGEAPIWMKLSAGGGELRVEVYDGGAGRPVRKRAAGDDECGRGLELLDGLIELHGGERGVITDPAGPGKTVYVVLSLAGAAVLQATRHSGG